MNTVGPVADTALAVAGACLRAGVHYLDLANELEPVRTVLGLDASARDPGATLVTGAGFGVLATEALVTALRADRPAAERAVAAALPGWTAWARRCWRGPQRAGVRALLPVASALFTRRGVRSLAQIIKDDGRGTRCEPGPGSGQKKSAPDS